MKHFELHIIQSLPPSCINRDELGQPKTAVYGGVERLRISAQSWKRAIKEDSHAKMPTLLKGIRTRYIQDLVAPEITAAGLNPALIEATANVLSTVEKNRVNTVVYISPGEVTAIVAGLTALGLPKTGAIKDTKEVEKTVLKAIKTYQLADAADIAIFGRMFANHHSLNVDGSSYFNHPISTHAAASEADFFTAMDERNTEDGGAGMMGTSEFSSGVVYRYICLNTQELMKSFPTLTPQVIQTFIESAILSIPQAKRTSMNGHTTPAYVLAIATKEGQNQQLCEAFETPIVATTGYLKPSIEALIKMYHSKVKAEFLKPSFVGAINTSGLVTDIPEFSLSQLAQKIVDQLT